MKYLIIILFVFGCLKGEGQHLTVDSVVQLVDMAGRPVKHSDWGLIPDNLKAIQPIGIYVSDLNSNDTLFIPEGKYKFLKIGDRLYKIKTTLEEIPETSHCILEIGRNLIFPN